MPASACRAHRRSAAGFAVALACSALVGCSTGSAQDDSTCDGARESLQSAGTTAALPMRSSQELLTSADRVMRASGVVEVTVSPDGGTITRRSYLDLRTTPPRVHAIIDDHDGTHEAVTAGGGWIYFRDSDTMMSDRPWVRVRDGGTDELSQQYGAVAAAVVRIGGVDPVQDLAAVPFVYGTFCRVADDTEDDTSDDSDPSGAGVWAGDWDAKAARASTSFPAQTDGLGMVSAVRIKVSLDERGFPIELRRATCCPEQVTQIMPMPAEDHFDPPPAAEITR